MGDFVHSRILHYVRKIVRNNKLHMRISFTYAVRAWGYKTFISPSTSWKSLCLYNKSKYRSNEILPPKKWLKRKKMKLHDRNARNYYLPNFI